MPRGQKLHFKFKPLPWLRSRPDTFRPTVGLEYVDGQRSPKDILGEPLTLGEWVTVEFQELPWNVEAKVADVKGAWQIVGLRIEANGLGLDVDGRLIYWEGPNPTITTDLLRQIPLRMLREAAVDVALGTNGWFHSIVTERPPEGWGNDHYERVAEVYKNAASAPTKAVADAWGVSRAAASKWIAKARELGYLGYPDRRGVAGASESVSPIKTTHSIKKEDS